jgi:CRISPR-associated exonuclease Cas4
MSFSEDDLLPLSGLQHMSFCERQWALIHLEAAWAENRLTVEGRNLHERVHEIEPETRNGVRIARGLRLRSLRLGLIGQADVVEFHREPAGRMPALQSSYSLRRESDFLQPFPVEYKRGRPKPTRCDEVQLCAQALCLEEMLGVSIPAGAIFYGQPRRRQDVAFDAALRNETEEIAARMHQLFRVGETPPARYEPRCDNCSLIDLCMPKSAVKRKDAHRYVEAIWGGGET